MHDRYSLVGVAFLRGLDLYNGLASSGQSLEDFLTTDPQRYFPPVLRRRYRDLIPGHRLSREILATLIANNIVNRMGPVFVQRMQQDTGVSTVTIARAYVIARELCRASAIWRNIEALDNEVPASVQQSVLFELSRTLRHACYWLIDRYGNELAIVPTVERLKAPMHTIYNRANSIVVGAGKQRQKAAAAELAEMRVPPRLARMMASLLLTRGGLDIADLATDSGADLMSTARTYATLSERLGVVWLHRRVENLTVDGRWQAIARSNLRDEFYRIRRDLAGRILQANGDGDLQGAFEQWLEDQSVGVQKFDSILSDMKLREEPDFATLSVAAQELRKLIAE